MHKNGFGIDNFQWLTCNKTKPNQTKRQLQRGKTPPNEYSGYDTKPSDSESPVVEL